MAATRILLLVASTFLMPAASATAQSFYAAAMLESGEGHFPDIDVQADLAGVLGLAGVRLSVSERFFVAGEAEVAVGQLASNGSDGFPAIDSLQRYRAVIGANISNVSLFVGTGLGEISTSGPEATSAGASLNFGVDVAVSPAMRIRFEAIQDRFDDAGGTPFDNDVVRVGTVINF